MCQTGSGDRFPWIAIDFGTTVKVTRVEIFIPDNCCGEQTRNVNVRISSNIPTYGNQMFFGGSLLGRFRGPAVNGQHILFVGKMNMLSISDYNQYSRSAFFRQVCRCPNGQW